MPKEFPEARGKLQGRPQGFGRRELGRGDIHASRHEAGGSDEINGPIVPSSVTVTDFMRGATSLWWHHDHIAPFSADPGASGATWIDPQANRIGGWQLNHEDEHLHLHIHLEDEWDAASDVEFHVVFEINAASVGSGDTVDLKLIAFYKGDGEATTKTQTIEAATTVGVADQYTQFEAQFTIPYAPGGGNNIDMEDSFGLTINLETDTSEVDDITINWFEFKYKTAKVRGEI